MASILVIDDDNLMRDYVQEALNRGGHEVDAVASGQEGIDRFSRTGYDVVVTDLKMKPVNGLEVLHRLRAEGSRTRCIIMTAYGTVETAVEALKEGADDYIMKPFSPDELELAVARVLEIERLERLLMDALDKTPKSYSQPIYKILRRKEAADAAGGE